MRASSPTGTSVSDGLRHRYIEVAGIGTHYVTAGEGPPVVLIHGLGSSAATWQRTIPSLADRHTVYALDMPGHGDSEKPEVQYSLEAGVAYLAAFLDALNIPRTALVGNSMGGLLSLGMALEHPERITRLALVDAAGLGRELAIALRLASLPVVGELMRRGSVFGFARALMREASYKGRISWSVVMDAFRGARIAPEASRAELNALRNGVNFRGVRPGYILLDRLPELQTPLLIVWGAQDKVLPVAHAYTGCREAPGGADGGPGPVRPLAAAGAGGGVQPRAACLPGGGRPGGASRMNDPLVLGLAVAMGYLLGSVPMSHLMARAWGQDAFALGTRNPGAANVFRTVGHVPGALALLGDAGKGVLAVVVAALLGVEGAWLLIPGTAAVLGHVRSVFLGLRGGGGLATTLGVTLAVIPLPTVAGAVPGFLMLAKTHNTGWSAGLGLAVAMGLAPVFDYSMGTVLGVLLLGAAIMVRANALDRASARRRRVEEVAKTPEP